MCSDILYACGTSDTRTGSGHNWGFSGKDVMSKTICYCYNYSDEDIRSDVLQNNGRSTILEHITEEKKKGACQCKTKHPEGR